MSSGIKQSSFDEQAVAEEAKIEASCPLSFAQEGLWFLHKLEPDSSAYNICRLVRFKGELNVAALGWSLNRIIERHETLRTSFGTREEEPCQIISSPAPLQLVVENFSQVAHGERGAAAVELAQAEAERPFDLRQALLRARLLRLASDEHVLVLCVHHIVCDGWSVEVLFTELEEFYNSVCTGVPATLAEACETIAKAMRADCPPEIVGGFRAGDMRHCLGDPSTVSGVLGRRPLPLSEGAMLAFARNG